MTRENVYEKLNEIFKDVFDDDELIVTDDTVSEQVEGWDSLTHISLVATIEEEFGIHFNMDNIAKMKNVSAMVDLIMEQTK